MNKDRSLNCEGDAFSLALAFLDLLQGRGKYEYYS